MNAVRILAIAKRHWWVLKRSPHRSFDVVLWPIVDTLTFGSLAIAYQQDQKNVVLLRGHREDLIPYKER